MLKIAFWRNARLLLSNVVWQCWIPAKPAAKEAMARRARLLVFNVLTCDPRMDDMQRYLNNPDVDVIGLLKISHG